jgi:hypothetical protein
MDLLSFLQSVYTGYTKNFKIPLHIQQSLGRKGKIVRLLAINEHRRTAAVATFMLHLNIRCKWMVSFTPRPLYACGRALSASWVGNRVYHWVSLHVLEKKNIPRLRILQAVESRYTDWAIPLLESKSEVKCSDVRLNGAVGNLNEIKTNERVVKCNEV